MAKRKNTKRKRSTSEKVMIVLGILIALSMIFSLIVGLGSSGSESDPTGSLPGGLVEPIVMAIENAQIVGAIGISGAIGFRGL